MTRFPAKLLLFGEYSILMRSSALSLPFDHFGASLEFMGRELAHPPDAVQSAAELKRMAGYFSSNSEVFGRMLDLERLAADVAGGLFLESTIPQQYGLGSSGALCAAVYARYRIAPGGDVHGSNRENPGDLRASFIRMESFFHGKSSGFDPLVSYLKTALLVGKDGEVSMPGVSLSSIHLKGLELFLVDSGQPCNTGHMVAGFLDRFAPGGNITPEGNSLCTMADDSVAAFLDGDIDAFLAEAGRLSAFQLNSLHSLVPVKLQPVWSYGLQSGLFTMKLCGSGGGGFLLCFTTRREEAVEYFISQDLRVIDAC